MPAQESTRKDYPFLTGSGETGTLIINFDWSATSLGYITGWPASLRTTLANLLHSSFPMFLFWGPELLCFYNDAFRPSLGINGKHPAIGKPGTAVWREIWDFIGPLIQRVMQTGQPVWYEDQLTPIFRNGQIEDVYWTFSYSPAYGDEGLIEGVLVTCIETTEAIIARAKIEQTVARRTEELAQANATLQQANHYLQSTINLFKEPLQILLPVVEDGEITDFRFKLTNAAYAVYASTTPEALVGRKVSEVFPGYLQTSSFHKNVEVFKNGGPETWELHYDQDGLDLYNLMSATKRGEELLVHFTDFTRLKLLELELVKKIEELNRSNANLGEFAHAASHDLKEPIRKIRIFTQMLAAKLQDQLDGSQLAILEKIVSAGARMGRLVDDLLAYSHLTQEPRQKESVKLSALVKDVVADLELVIEEKGAIIALGTLPTVNAFRRQLQQSFQNLIGNALKYNKPRVAPEIRITATEVFESGKAFHLIEIADNGIGFEQQYADRIFHMFARLHNEEEYSGTGIGLSIVKRAIENHNGIIRVESIPGIGSVFKIYLPVE